MTSYKRVDIRKKYSYLTKKEANKAKRDFKRFAKNVRVSTRKDKDFGKLHHVSFTINKYMKQ